MLKIISLLISIRIAETNSRSYSMLVLTWVSFTKIALRANGRVYVEKFTRYEFTSVANLNIEKARVFFKQKCQARRQIAQALIHNTHA